MRSTPDLFTQQENRLQGKLARVQALLSESIEGLSDIPALPDSWLARVRTELEHEE